MSDTLQLLIIQFVVFLILLFVVIYLVRFNRSIKFEKRIGKYSIDSITSKSSSFFDIIYRTYQRVVKGMSKFLIQIKIFNKYSIKFEKYIDYIDKNGRIPMDFISNKILVSIAFILINFLANIIQARFPSFFEVFSVAVIGFFVPDLLTMYRNYLKNKAIEKDMLNAIIIMNNAFKSGRSTMQAIEIVRNELKGPIKEEFRKMHTEIAYGLSLEVVFKRFTERVDLEEVRYITSSLTILNQTGGNIVKVFSSIERSLFSKRRLELELKSLTASSNTMSRILLLLPIVFTGVIVVVNPDYFNPLFDTQIGVIALCFIILFYILYIIFVRKLMKVRMWLYERWKSSFSA